MRQEPTIIDMTIEGGFASPEPEQKPPFSTQVMVWASAIAALAMAGAIAVFAIWLLAFLIPIAIIAALLAYAAFRFQLWRSGGSADRIVIRWPPRR